MGLIRKTISVGTAGVVKGSSKKQRTAKATLAAIEEQNRILSGQPAPVGQEIPRAAKVAAGVLLAGIVLVVVIVGVVSGGSSGGSALAAADVRDALATYNVPVKGLAKSKEGCVALIPKRASDIQDYGFFTVDVSTSKACDAALSAGTAGDNGIYWRHANGLWFGESKIARNVWLQTTRKARGRTGMQAILAQSVSSAVKSI